MQRRAVSRWLLPSSAFCAFGRASLGLPIVPDTGNVRNKMQQNVPPKEVCAAVRILPAASPW